MDQLLQAIRDALARKGLSEAAASQIAVGNPSAIKNLRVRRGNSRNHPIENLVAVARVLDLELYLGPPRPVLGENEIIEQEQLATQFAKIPFYEQVRLSAGDGNFGEELSTELTFRIDWLRRHNLQVDKCVVVRVRGDSMQPTLQDDDLVLLDRAQDRIVNGEVFGIIDPDGAALVKRIERTDKALLIRSDNPHVPTRVLDPGEANRVSIIGRVAWHGHYWS